MRNFLETNQAPKMAHSREGSRKENQQGDLSLRVGAIASESWRMRTQRGGHAGTRQARQHKQENHDQILRHKPIVSPRYFI